MSEQIGVQRHLLDVMYPGGCYLKHASEFRHTEPIGVAVLKQQQASPILSGKMRRASLLMAEHVSKISCDGWPNHRCCIGVGHIFAARLVRC